MRRLRDPKIWLLIAVFAVYAVALGRDALFRAPGPHDNDWTLLMWLGKHSDNLAALAVGHYGALQLVLVRWLYPVFGTTLAAAKVLNVAGTVAAGVAAFVMLRHKGFGWGLVAASAFLLWPSVYLTGQSEFGDPFSLGLFSLGVAILLEDDPPVRNFVFGGLLMGIAGCARLHFQTFGWAALLPLAGYLVGERYNVRKLTGAAAGLLIGQLPMFIINWRVHHTLFSPIARGFIGHVVVEGANVFDMPGTHMRHPFDEILREHKVRLLEVITERLLDCPPALLVLLALATAGLVVVRDKKLGLFWLLAVGYYVGFVTPSWGITLRLIEPFVLFIICAATSAIAPMMRTERVRLAAVVTCLVLACLNLRLAKGVLRAERTRINNSWARNAEIARIFRDHGATDPLQTFAVDWWTHPVDDPEFIPYYNFGFWDLLVPEFAEERPNPFPYLQEPAAFFVFLREHGVRYIVLERNSPLVTLNPFCDSNALPGGYARLGTVDNQCLFALE